MVLEREINGRQEPPTRNGSCRGERKPVHERGKSTNKGLGWEELENCDGGWSWAARQARVLWPALQFVHF